MKYLPIDANLYIKNRKKLAENMIAGSIAIFNSNDVLPTNADGTMMLRQNNDLLYLSGVDQEESILIVFPDCPVEKHREILFVKETNEEIAIWEGEKLTKAKATENSGIKTIYWLQDFHKILRACPSYVRSRIENGERYFETVKYTPNGVKAIGNKRKKP